MQTSPRHCQGSGLLRPLPSLSPEPLFHLSPLLPEVSFLLSRALCSLSPYLVAPSRATSPAPRSGWRGCGGPVLQGRSRPPHCAASIGSAEGLRVKPGSDWPVPPVRPALAMVTTLGPPGEFHIPPPPAAPPGPAGIPRAPPPPLSGLGPGPCRGGGGLGDLQEGTRKLGSEFGVRRTPPRLLSR